MEGDDEVIEATTDLEEHLQRLSRIDSKPSVWCKCKYCKTMPVNWECLCCVEIDEIKYKKLSKGMNYT